MNPNDPVTEQDINDIRQRISKIGTKVRAGRLTHLCIWILRTNPIDTPHFLLFVWIISLSMFAAGKYFIATFFLATAYLSALALHKAASYQVERSNYNKVVSQDDLLYLCENHKIRERVILILQSGNNLTYGRVLEIGSSLAADLADLIAIQRRIASLNKVKGLE